MCSLHSMSLGKDHSLSSLRECGLYRMCSGECVLYSECHLVRTTSGRLALPLADGPRQA